MPGFTVRPLSLLAVGIAALAAGMAGRAEDSRRLGYLHAIPPESAAASAERHARVAQRREQQSILIVHRGASMLAPENTLEAYAAAMDYGADGCEVDLRRTRDGELVLFHDDMLDALTNGIGTVPDLTTYELLGLKPRRSYGTATRETRPPTFAALLALACQRAMLLHLDVKETHLEAEMSRLLTEADAWDHVVAANFTTAPALRGDTRLRLLGYKGPGLYEDFRDLDPESVRAQAALPGRMIMIGDPRVAARELGRPPYVPVPIPPLRRQRLLGRVPARPANAAFSPPDFLQRYTERDTPLSRRELVELLEFGSPEERAEFDGTPEYVRRRTEGIVTRAWAAQRLAELGLPSDPAERRRAVAALENNLRVRSLHRDWQYNALDGAMAARALGSLRVKGASTLLSAELRRVDPEWKAVQNPEFGPYPVSYVDFRVKMALFPALGALHDEVAKRTLQEFVRLSEAAAKELAPPSYEEATRALLQCRLSHEELEELLRSDNMVVRGMALLECRDHPSRTRTAALRAVHPWAFNFPAAVR